MGWSVPLSGRHLSSLTCSSPELPQMAQRQPRLGIKTSISPNERLEPTIYQLAHPLVIGCAAR